jgi:5-oxoprolinase (ATP-hydrolysing)
MAAPRWEFWIDVGGTFTDCLAKLPDGSIRRHKLLSSGVTKGRIGDGSSQHGILDAARADDPDDFWTGWRLVLLDAEGREIDSAEVTGFERAAHRLSLTGPARSPAPGTTYELRCGLEAPVVAIRYLMAIPLAQPVPPVSLRLGTTRGTNALITRTGARTVLVTTQGFGDVLEIGYQARPRLFDLTVRKPPTLPSAVFEIAERVTHDGAVLSTPEVTEVRTQLEELRRTGVESLAICFLHADRHPAHERLVERIARDVGFEEISVSHRVAPLPKLVPRADTTVVDAYLNPVLRDYVLRLRDSLPGSQLRLLTSAGGLVDGESFCGKDSILSGPAGGVVGFSRVAQAVGFDRAIGFDMGGTSTDVSRFDGRFELEYETQKAGVRLVAPTMAVETVAAGGGSICRFDGVKFVVGPESAGADPGPACYGRGGPLTITDVNFHLGRIVPERFPFPLERNATRLRLEELAAEAKAASASVATDGDRHSLDNMAAGLLQVANARMAAAIRLVTVAKGADPADYVLVAFGGAAGQHACAIARELGIKRVLNHPEAGVLSALGIGLADVTRHRSCGVERPLNAATLAIARKRLAELRSEAEKDLLNEGVAAKRITATESLDVRYQGVDSYLTIPWPADDDFAEAFANAHRKRYGYTHEGRSLEVLAARIELVGHVAAALPRSERRKARPAVSARTVNAYFDGKREDVPLFDRRTLTAGDHIEGPAIITEDIATTVIEPGWQSEVLSGGELLLEEQQDRGSRHTIHNPEAEIEDRPDPVLLEIFNNLLASIAEQMGVTLRNTASSVNVKERLDFSCAIFTADGRLVVNAPHVPVHLGAMEETVRQTIAANPDLQSGDVIATNDPYAGGSHLPDITVITPIHDAGGRPLFFTASRAHHAEIGGMAPGSMPPLSKNLAQEGVLIRNLKIVAAGESRFDVLRDVLLSGPYPTRDVATNLADIEAQIAANRQGAADLATLVERFSWPVVEQYMNLIQDAAEQKVSTALSRLRAGAHRFTDYLELADGTIIPISVTLSVSSSSLPLREEGPSRTVATIDFTGTGAAVEGNLNANRAIVTAAVIYMLRLLVDEDIPLNHGVLRPIEIVLPMCLLNPEPGPTPETTPAVAGGNVETSQRVVDVLLGALGIAGASQGTMNNVIFGDNSFGYYETVCGGSGATADGAGASAVQVHMTNTRLTDPEVLERRFPVRVREFAIRRGSGGAGQHHGGDGVVRRLEFLRPLTLSLLTQRRGAHPPYGAAGGGAGMVGRNTLARGDGSQIELPAITQVQVAPGDILTIETPGGGGFGAPH